MKKKTILLCSVVGGLLFAGCASTHSSLESVDPVQYSIVAENRAVGFEQVKVLGPVFLETDSRCFKSDFLHFAKTQYREMDDVIEIEMGEKSLSSRALTTFSCRYSGLAVSYTPLSVEEASLWVDVMLRSRNLTKMDSLDSVQPKIFWMDIVH